MWLCLPVADAEIACLFRDSITDRFGEPLLEKFQRRQREQNTSLTLISVRCTPTNTQVGKAFYSETET